MEGFGFIDKHTHTLTHTYTHTQTHTHIYTCTLANKPKLSVYCIHDLGIAIRHIKTAFERVFGFISAKVHPGCVWVGVCVCVCVW